MEGVEDVQTNGYIWKNAINNKLGILVKLQPRM